MKEYLQLKGEDTGGAAIIIKRRVKCSSHVKGKDQIH